jgi:hypothetical protein
MEMTEAAVAGTVLSWTGRPGEYDPRRVMDGLKMDGLKAELWPGTRFLQRNHATEV